MSLSGILGNALSGLTASQAGMRSSSNNVANVNTPGYARTSPNMVARNVGGTAMGVEVTGITRITDQFLQVASLNAISAAGQTSAIATALDRVQSQFGGLDDPGSMFSRMNKVFESVAQASVDPSLAVSRLAVGADIDSFFDETKRLSMEIKTQRQEADARISAGVERANQLMNELFELNTSVQNMSAGGGDTSGAANRQSELLDELSNLLDIRAVPQSDGRVVLRTEDGVLLLDNFVATLQYTPTGTGSYKSDYGRITAANPNGTATELESHIMKGELRGLIELRDEILPEMAEELGEISAAFADALNQAHNDSSSYPAPQTLTGRNTGLNGTDQHNFTGATTLAVTSNTGTLVSRIDIDFDAGTLSVDGGAAAAIGATVNSLTAAINTALGANGSASFTNGVMSVSASAGTNGVAFLQDATTPSDRGGRGFSHFFGLNDLVVSDRIGFHETGMTGADATDFAAGQNMVFDIVGPQGQPVTSVTVATVAGDTFTDLINDLNDPTNGVGRYVTFSLDADGRLVETPVAGFEQFGVTMISDDTQRAGSGKSMSELFGMTLYDKANRSEEFSVKAAIRADSSQLSLAQLDIDGASVVGDIVLSTGDNRGGRLLQAAMDSPRSFNQAGSLASSTATLQDYSARIAGVVGSRAARAESMAESNVVLMDTAAQKRADVEGVNLDEELAAMTMYQQSYNASARMLQAAKEMADALMRVV
ncbi:flagellar hook-associated protein FlgK [Maricaulis sp.]|uniref:flagellar hook-associated protein FlgK n=1 Tax=unclassified Maricaulis TaxID=2632371 RepID=UPI001B17E99E|nr:flagellar hook-associated protein FlgK [Maricaulis sp.]MBO6797361.1 flagellar hook-associated protein FlgK [Maricaulis sp.]